MRIRSNPLLVLLGVCLAAGCSTPQRGESGRDFEFFLEDGELAEVEFSDFTGSADLLAERERTGVRFAWGGEKARGFFQVFLEDFTAGALESDLAGIGGGVKGAPQVGKGDGDITYVVPYRFDISLAAGEADIGLTGADLAYLEYHAELGFGALLNGFQLSGGVALSSLTGLASIDGFVDLDVDALNIGFYGDLQYHVPESPLYGHVRSLSGDYEALTLGVGLSF